MSIGEDKGEARLLSLVCSGHGVKRGHAKAFGIVEYLIKEAVEKKWTCMLCGSAVRAATADDRSSLAARSPEAIAERQADALERIAASLTILALAESARYSKNDDKFLDAVNGQITTELRVLVPGWFKDE